MPSARYRPPTSVPEPSSPLFRPWLLAQLREIAQDGAALSLSDPPTSISLERIEVPAGAQRRVQPTASGMVAVLEAPSSANAGLSVTFFVENPAGALTVVASPHVAADGKVTRTKINGQRKATYTLAGVVQLFSNGQDSWNAFAETPEETPLLVSRMGPTGPAGPPGTSAGLRRLRRHVFYADGSCDIIENGSTTTVTLGEFGLEADGNAYRVWLVPGGNGGPRGPRAVGTNGISPAAPGGGAVAVHIFWREELEDYITALGTDIPVTVGAAGTAAAATTADVTQVVAAIGTAGGATRFGDLLAAFPGGIPSLPAAINTTAAQPGGGGGGWLSAGANGGADPWGGAPLNTTASSGMADGDYGGGVGDLGGTTGNNQGAGSGLYGGGGGGGQQGSAAANGRPGGRSMFGVPGAGAGGSWNSTGTARNGGNGGKRGPPAAGTQSPTRSFTGGPTGGSGSAANTDGVAGADGADGILGLYPGESGAGGGAASRDTAGTTRSGRGGDGGFPGGSGGGGGSARSSGVAGCLAIAERGGNGAEGVAVIDTLG